MGRSNYTLPSGGGVGHPSFRVSFNNADQRSVGEELMPGSPFHTFPGVGAAGRELSKLRADGRRVAHGGPLEGLRVQIEYLDQRVIGAPLPSDDFTQFRAIVNYAIPLL